MKIVRIPAPGANEAAFLEARLLAFNGRQVPGYAYENIVFNAVDDDAVIAGIHGQIGGGWLYIVSLWVADDRRGQGLGRRLLQRAENTAAAKNCHSAYLYTYSFQNPQFYQRCGYRVFGKLENFGGSHIKFFMQKELVEGRIHVR